MLSVSILRHLVEIVRFRIVCAGIMQQQLDSSNDRAGGQFRRRSNRSFSYPGCARAVQIFLCGIMKSEHFAPVKVHCRDPR